MPVFVGAGTSSFMKASEGIGFTRLTTTQRDALSGTSRVQGQVIFNTTTGVLEIYDGTAWTKVSSVLAVLNSISGDILAGSASTLTLTGQGFLATNLVVNFTQADDGINVNVSVTPASDTSATVTVPASVYSNVTAGRVVTITVTNSDGSTSTGVTKTAAALPSGGSITTSGAYRIHTFTSSGTFVNTLSSLSVEYLVIAGGGGTGARRHGGGAGAGGYRCSVSGETSGRGASAESPLTLNAGNYTVTVGGGGASSTSGSNSNSGNTNGSNSVFHTITSLGGGWGGTYNSSGNSGGCG